MTENSPQDEHSLLDIVQGVNPRKTLGVKESHGAGKEVLKRLEK